MDDHIHLTRRERQIMDVLYERGEASVGEVHRTLPDAPSYSAVRALMRKLLDKGHAAYREDGTRYLYRPGVDAHPGPAQRLGPGREHVLRRFRGGCRRRPVGLEE